jgi:hypothetical protein
VYSAFKQIAATTQSLKDEAKTPQLVAD